MSKKTSKNEHYNLSEESKKSSNEFSEASRIASVLRNDLNSLIFGKDGRTLYRRLLSVVISVLGTGSSDKKGRRSLGDGDVGLFRELELNPYTNFNSIAYFKLKGVDILPSEGKIVIKIPKIGSDEFKWPEKGVLALIRVSCVIISSEEENPSTVLYKTGVLTYSLGGKAEKAKKAVLNVGEIEEKTVLIAMGVSFILADSMGFEAFESYNSNYYAARIAEAVYIKNGKVVEFKKEKEIRGDDDTPSGKTSFEKSGWEDDED